MEDIGIATCDRLRAGTADDRLLAASFERLGARCAMLVWSEAEGWSEGLVALVRSTWDYHLRQAEWRDWLARAERSLVLFNSIALLRWNMDKSYLQALADTGVPIIDTIVFKGGSLEALASEVCRRRWKQLVVKPAIGASASGVLRASAADAGWRAHAQSLARSGAVLVQPYLPSVEEEQECSLVFIDGELSHAFRKPAFSSNAEGTTPINLHEPSRREIDVAMSALCALPEQPLYARVDLVPGAGGPLLMELELIEPDLGLRLRPGCADLLAAACLARC